jgi:hypothetical protein
VSDRWFRETRDYNEGPGLLHGISHFARKFPPTACWSIQRGFDTESVTSIGTIFGHAAS